MVNGGVTWNEEVISYEAGADLSNCRYKFVKLNADGKPVPVAAVTDKPIGVCRDPFEAGDVVAVWQGTGIVPLQVTAGGIAPGDLLGPSADGRGVKIVAGTDATKYACAIAQEASGAADEVISVQLIVPASRAV